MLGLGLTLVNTGHEPWAGRWLVLQHQWEGNLGVGDRERAELGRWREGLGLGGGQKLWQFKQGDSSNMGTDPRIPIASGCGLSGGKAQMLPLLKETSGSIPAGSRSSRCHFGTAGLRIGLLVMLTGNRLKRAREN